MKVHCIHVTTPGRELSAHPRADVCIFCTGQASVWAPGPLAFLAVTEVIKPQHKKRAELVICLWRESEFLDPRPLARKVIMLQCCCIDRHASHRSRRGELEGGRAAGTVGEISSNSDGAGLWDGTGAHESIGTGAREDGPGCNSLPLISHRVYFQG